jgi:hypothetical protein
MYEVKLCEHGKVIYSVLCDGYERAIAWGDYFCELASYDDAVIEINPPTA